MSGWVPSKCLEIQACVSFGEKAIENNSDSINLHLILKKSPLTSKKQKITESHNENIGHLG